MKPHALLRRASRPIARTGLLWAAERLFRDPANYLRVLTYHRVAPLDERPDLWPALISATPERFAEQVDGLARCFQFVSLEAVLEAQRGGAPLPTRALLLTFDDAYVDFADFAWPTLKERGLPGVLFVPTAFADDSTRRFWWDDLHDRLPRTGHASIETPVGRFECPRERDACFAALRTWFKEQPIASATAWLEGFRVPAHAPSGAVAPWAVLQKLAAEGATLCAHTRTHPSLPRLDREAVLKEMRQSLADLREHIGPTEPAFAYPSGLHNDEVVDCAREAGFEFALTIQPGAGQIGHTDPLRFPRIGVTRNASPEWIRLKMLGLRARGTRHANRSR